MKRLNRQKWTILFLQIISISIVLMAPYSDSRHLFVVGHDFIIRPLGLMLNIGGYALMNLAILHLGRQFSLEVTIQKDHRLITHGIYSVVRHPRYLGIILFMAGISLVFNAGIAVMLAIATIIVLLWRIIDEERMMHREFREAWEEYTKKTWKLIPYIY